MGVGTHTLRVTKQYQEARHAPGLTTKNGKVFMFRLYYYKCITVVRGPKQSFDPLVSMCAAYVTIAPCCVVVLLVEITGYYARVKSVHSLLKQFITLTKSAGLKSQVISLGAGYDTTYWQLHSTGSQPTTYLEVDLATVTSKKCQYIR